MSELIELEKPKRKLTEKQIENLKRMREKKLEVSKAKKVLKIEKPKKELPTKVETEENRIVEKKFPEYSPDLKTRLTALERDISEIKMRKQIKSELKQKMYQIKIDKSKAVDKDESETQSKKFEETKEQLSNFNYNNLFY